MDSIKKQNKCKLCGNIYPETEMSEEHYPARSTGNEDIVAVDIVEIIDSFQTDALGVELERRIKRGETIEEISDKIFDTRLSKSLYPDGRSSKTLCRKCNIFLGKYDEAYLKFFNADGNPKLVKGFQQQTKYQIIKAIYAKFLSLPETINEEFDFIDFIRDEKASFYDGEWMLYFVKRNFSSDILGLKDIETGKLIFNEGVVYEMSDNKFIFNLMNFPKHACYEMTNIFDILDKRYRLVEGVGEKGGYHAQMLFNRLFSEY